MGHFKMAIQTPHVQCHNHLYKATCAWYFKDICGGCDLPRGRKAFSEKTTHSCLRSFLWRNRSDKAPLILTQPAMPGYSYPKTMMNFSGQSKLWSEVIARGLVCWHWSRLDLCVWSRNYETFFIYSRHVNWSRVKALTGNQAIGKRVFIKIFNIYFRALAVYVGPDTLCNIRLKKAKSDQNIGYLRKYVLNSGRL